MKQLSLAETGFLPKASKPTRKAGFLAERERVVPWSRLEALIEPFSPKRGNGRPPRPLGTRLRIHFLQQWFGYSDPAREEALHDLPLRRPFAGLDAFEEGMPDESPILRFRPLRESHPLAAAICAEVNALRAEQGLTRKRGSGVEARLSAAPRSTQNRAKQRDPEMSPTQTGNPGYLGLKAPLGVDAESGRGQTVECTTAQGADHTMMKACLPGEETLALGDRGYPQKNRPIEALQAEEGVGRVTPTKKPQGGELTEEPKGFNRVLSAVRAVVEPPFPRGQDTVRLYPGALSRPAEAHRADRDAVCAGQSVAGATPMVALAG